MKEYYVLLRLNKKEHKIINIKEENKVIWVELESNKKKVRCPNCNSFTSSIHSKLKPIKSTYIDACGEGVKLLIHKRRFHCYKCNKIFTEEMNITDKNGRISNATKIQIRKDLLDYNLTIDYIAKKNHVSKYIVRKELIEATITILEIIKYNFKLSYKFIFEILLAKHCFLKAYLIL